MKLFKDELEKNLFSDHQEISHLSREDLVLEIRVGIGSIKNGFISDYIERFDSLSGIERDKNLVLKALKFFSFCCQSREIYSNSFLVRVVIRRNTFELNNYIVCRHYEISRDIGQWRIKRFEKC